MSAKLHVYNTAMIRRLTPLYVNLGDPLMRNNITCNKMQGTLSTVCIIFARGYLIRRNILQVLCNSLSYTLYSSTFFVYNGFAIAGSLTSIRSHISPKI